MVYRQWHRRAEALGLHNEARLRGLSQATQVAFVTLAEGFSPTAAATKSSKKRALLWTFPVSTQSWRSSSACC